ncbi:DpnI domain-containing protein [Rhodanobacter sp. Root480]|uniref:DpnI domain-containing protein n=1 Tax=Rhodanobacter sp. Root480 TaxID=1736542 RepID=UPI0009E94E75|nr:DpnI domain-containing protein [Rhodanobacter sp. Root480]
MDLNFDALLAAHYKGPTQWARVVTERWVSTHLFCPSCGHSLESYPNNTPAADFLCLTCHEQFELKSKQGLFGSRIVDGAYSAMLRRLRSNQAPNLLGLTYDRAQARVRNLFVIPSQFFVPEIIERRKPLAPTARRAGWVGCNILVRKVPPAGRVSIITDGVAIAKGDVLKAWRRTLFLRDQPQLEKRGWLLDVMNCVERLEKPQFQLSDVYQHEDSIARLHPGNRHVRAKIRQQLQVLRDSGFLEFLGQGQYRVR